MLKKIKLKDISWYETSLVLDDYDWMNYKLKASLDIQDGKRINIRFEYYGATKSIMVINLIVNDSNLRYIYSYPTEKFKNYITKYMLKHMDSWDEKHAFDGIDMVIEFYNDVIKNGKYLRGSDW